MPRTSLLTLILSADGSSAKAHRALATLDTTIGQPEARRSISADTALDGLDQMFAYFDPLPKQVVA